MRNEYLRYFVGFLITIGLILVVVALLFRGGGTPKNAAPTPKTLNSYSTTDAVVRLTISGPVSAPQTHNQIQITVGRDTAVYQQVVGYDGGIVKAQGYDNTQNSYYIFLSALARAGFTLGNNDSKLANSAGACPLGLVYTFQLLEDGKSLSDYWATSCGNPRNFNGNVNLNLALFRAQIPDYNALTSGLNIY